MKSHLSGSQSPSAAILPPSHRDIGMCGVALRRVAVAFGLCSARLSREVITLHYLFQTAQKDNRKLFG